MKREELENMLDELAHSDYEPAKLRAVMEVFDSLHEKIEDLERRIDELIDDNY